MTGYQPDWDVDRAAGEQAEQLYESLRSDVLSGTAEVKLDRRAAETGRIYLETECKRADGWQPSGIVTTRAERFVYVLGDDIVLAVPTDKLKRLGDEAALSGHTAEERDGSHPTRGVLLAVSGLLPSRSAARRSRRSLAGGFRD